MWARHIGRNQNSGVFGRDTSGSTRTDNGSDRDLRNPPERTERIEKVVEKVVREHRETLEKLADE